MNVVCGVRDCYYYDRGFCTNPLTAINEAGMCSVVYGKSGKPRNYKSAEGKAPRSDLRIVTLVGGQKDDDDN